MKFKLLAIVILGLFMLLLNSSAAIVSAAPLSNAIILIIRHAEKPDEGNGLTPSGQARAQAYVKYFENYKVDNVSRPPDYLFAATDTARSQRPRLTVTPLSVALRLPIDTRFKDKDTRDLANALQTEPMGKTILICWHHEEIADLLTSLGADPTTLIPNGNWSEDVYDWVIELHYDSAGKLIPTACKRISEQLMPGDDD